MQFWFTFDDIWKVLSFNAILKSIANLKYHLQVFTTLSPSRYAAWDLWIALVPSVSWELKLITYSSSFYIVVATIKLILDWVVKFLFKLTQYDFVGKTRLFRWNSHFFQQKCFTNQSSKLIKLTVLLYCLNISLNR